MPTKDLKTVLCRDCMGELRLTGSVDVKTPSGHTATIHHTFNALPTMTENDKECHACGPYTSLKVA